MFVLGVFLRLPAERAFFLAPAEAVDDKEEDDEGAEEAIVNGGGGFVVVVEEQRTVTSKSGYRSPNDATRCSAISGVKCCFHVLHLQKLQSGSLLREGRENQTTFLNAKFFDCLLSNVTFD